MTLWRCRRDLATNRCATARQAEMDHTIVIPTRNHPKRLALCLASILEARNSAWQYEVLVVDNSDPELRAANGAAVETCADSRVRYLGMTQVGLMAARHAGVEAA